MSKFNKLTGADRLFTLPYIIISGIFMIVVSIGIAKIGILSAGLFLAIPILIYFLINAYKNPQIILYAFLVLSFFVNGIPRYTKDLPIGLALDALLFICLIILFFKSFNEHIPWNKALNIPIIASFIWFAFTVLEIANPESRSHEAWFYAMRGVSMYMFLAIMLSSIIFNNSRQLMVFIYIWGILSMLATIKGAMQIYIGPDSYEKAWLDNGGAITHILFGKLRAFSFYSDAGQFGASQAQTGITALFMLLHPQTKKNRIFLILMMLTGFYGMSISGTRGAIVIPFASVALYLILIKNLKGMIVGTILAGAVFVFFKFTMIGQDNQQIRRMRTGFDPNDASLLVRLENQRKLSVYLASRPFGGGIGSSGTWGQRFTPGSFLAETPTDSWYVKIWAETGIIGLLIHVSTLLLFVFYGAYIIWIKIKNTFLKNQLIALISGIFGIEVASYGNSIFGQSPTGPIIYLSIAFIIIAPFMESNQQEEILSINS